MSKEQRREVLGVTKITHKFQITIPKRVRGKFSFNEGDLLVFVEEDGHLVLVKSTEY